MPKTTVLFFAEAVTLAHVARSYVLARSLDPSHYRVEFAADPRFDVLFDFAGLNRRPLTSISCDEFLASLAEGKPLYDSATLDGYVREELAVIEAVQPDLIVGDFRLSLSVSARLAAVPYVTITNAYWSPYAKQRVPVPELPVTRVLGPAVAQRLFDLVRPAAFALHTRPLNRVRARYGLDDLGLNLSKTYTDADTVLYADLPELVAMHPLPENHSFLGPVLWSPSGPLPDWWPEVRGQRPVVYVNLGSSGRGDLLPPILRALQQTDAFTIAATAGRADPPQPHPRLRTARYIPGDAAVSIADLVICNGGSPSTQQALHRGKPVLGIPANLDQHLNMQAIEAAGAGWTLRSERVTEGRVRRAVTAVLAGSGTTTAAVSLARRAACWQAAERFAAVVGQQVGAATGLHSAPGPN